jgi:glycosyltransferase involved in cell wall biosynthesis
LVTFNDLSIYKVPHCYPAIKIARNKAVDKLMAGKAEKIIAVSNSVKKDLFDIFKVPSGKVSVVYSGLDKRFFSETNGNTQKILEKFGITKKYILFLGTLCPSKNITGLLESFVLFKERIKKEGLPFDYQLVLGGKRGWLSREYVQQVKDLGLSKDVVFTGYIVGDEVVALFKNAQFFVMPSLYEGFGTTVLEAFATGTPAIVSRVSSVPEIAGDAAYFVDPMNKQEISEAIYKFSKDENLRNEYKMKGLEQAKKFDWKKTAKETLEIYKSFK